MAVTDWAIGYCTDTTARIWIRSDDGANYNWTVDTIGTTSVSTLGDDNTGSGEETGLAADTTYTFSITGGITGSFKTLPAAGEPVTITCAGCQNLNHDFIHGDAIADINPDGHIWTGDTPYTTTTDTVFGVSATSTETTQPSTEAQFHSQFRAFRNLPGVQYLNHRYPNIWVYDDHELPGDDWDTTPQTAHGSMSQANVNTTYLRGNAAWRAYHADLPLGEGTFSGVSPGDSYPPIHVQLATLPDANGNDTADWIPCWYETSWGMVLNLALDCIGSRSDIDTTDTSFKRMLSPTQRSDLISRVNSATETWVNIISSKRLGFDPAAGDGWPIYQTDLAEILDGITRKNVVWTHGDNHNPMAQRYFASPDGYSIAALGAGSASSKQFQETVEANTNTKYIGGLGTDTVQRKCFGRWDFTTDVATARIYDQSNRVIFKGTVLTGTSEWATFEDLIE